MTTLQGVFIICCDLKLPFHQRSALFPPVCKVRYQLKWGHIVWKQSFLFHQRYLRKTLQ